MLNTSFVSIYAPNFLFHTQFSHPYLSKSTEQCMWMKSQSGSVAIYPTSFLVHNIRHIRFFVYICCYSVDKIAERTRNSLLVEIHDDSNSCDIFNCCSEARQREIADAIALSLAPLVHAAYLFREYFFVGQCEEIVFYYQLFNLVR